MIDELFLMIVFVLFKNQLNLTKFLLMILYKPSKAYI